MKEPGSRKTAVAAFTQIVGAIVVRAREDLPLADSTWCHLAANLSTDIEELAWPFRSLLICFNKRALSAKSLTDLGVASRALFSFTFNNERAISLMSIAIEFVVDTYRSDRGASRALLSKLLTKERLATHAHEDMPNLARQATTLLQADPDFLAEIFGVVFSHSVSDDSTTSMGSSQILSLTSNRRQDYRGAQWSLKEVVPRFLETNPELAIQAISAALTGYAQRKYGNAATIEIATSRGVTTMVQDRSHVWAPDAEDRHARSDDAPAVIVAFKEHLEKASDEDARLLSEYTIRHAKPAVLWARLFLVGTRRVDLLGALLWPYAHEAAFLRTPETAKDAIDFVAAVYPLVDVVDRRLFEGDALSIPFAQSEDPERSKLRFLSTLFGSICIDDLATAEARQVVEEASQKSIPTGNHRSVEFTTIVAPAPAYHWLAGNADINLPANAALLHLVEQMNADVADFLGSLQASEVVAAAIAQADGAGVSARVTTYAEDQLGNMLEQLAHRKEALERNTTAFDRIWSLVSPALRHPRPAEIPGTASDQGPRASAAQAALRLTTISQSIADIVFPEVEPLANDHSVAVRQAFASRVACLWSFKRESFWLIAQRYIANETDIDVLRAITGLLCNAVHLDIERVEDLAIDLYPRGRIEQDSHGDSIVEGVASIATTLWTVYGRPRAHRLIEGWLAEPERYERELKRTVAEMRGRIAEGYGSQETNKTKRRISIQKLADEIGNHAAAILDTYHTKDRGEITEADVSRARSCASIIDDLGSELYFSSGATAQNHDVILLNGQESKKAFLCDLTPLIRRIGDVGLPHTIYYLIELLDFLRSADPAGVFDLLGHALLRGGTRHGYELESLAVKRFADIIGVYLADHRELFDRTERRELLIACLNVFVEAGWPEARRLLYRLPDIL